MRSLLLPNKPAKHSTRLREVALCLCVLAGMVAGEAVAQTAADSRILTALSRRGDLTLRDASLESAIFTISELWGINIVAGKVDGAVNGVFKNAPLKEILDSILQSNGYAYRPVGESLIVSRVEDLGQVNPFFASQTIPVGAAEVGEVVEAARLLSTPQGQVRALPSAGAVLVVDFPERVEKIRELIGQLDSATRSMAAPGSSGVGPRQLEVAYFRTHYVTALQAGTALDVVLSSDGRVASIEGEDRLLVVDYPEHVRMVEAVLARIDRPRPQVKIRSLIYDISLSDLEQIGVNWDGLTSGSVGADGAPSGGNGALVSTVTQAPFDASGSGGSFTFFSMSNNFSLQAVVLALQQAEDSRLLADPNVTVMDNEAASIQSISEVPFQQLTQTQGGGNIGTTAFKEVGIKLDVTPKISRDGTIDMTVVPEFSRLAGFTPGDNQPIIDTRRATTRVRVRDGQTLMIAGLRQRTDIGDFDGVPLLKDIRFVGHLFRSRDTQVTESELVVFVTPELVGYGDPLSERDRLTKETIDCRLDYIPAAEGCAGCGAQGACACNPEAGMAVATPIDVMPTEVVTTERVVVEVVESGPTLAEPAARTRPAAIEEMPVEQAIEEAIEVTPSAERVQPIELPTSGQSDGAEAAAKSSPLKQPSLAVNRLRRLPPTSNRELPTYDTLVEDSDAVRTPVTPETPLRVNYDGRFRATGGVYGSQQRIAERPSPPPATRDAAASEKSRSWGEWLLRR